MLNTFTYLAYLIISAYITLGVGRSLNRHGLVFLDNHLEGNRRLAEAINGLLLIGYYLVNAGYILLVLNWNTQSNIDDLNDLIRFLSMKLGLVTLMLGAMHMVIFYVLAHWKPVNIVTPIKEN